MKRNDFPLLNNNPDLAYLDNAATSQKPIMVIDAVAAFYSNDNANVHRGIYPLSERATEKYDESRKKIAEFLNADFEEIIFTQGTTDSMNAVAQMLGTKVSEGEVIVTTGMEHHGLLLPFQRLANNKKAQLKYVAMNSDLTFDIENYKKILDEGNTKIVAVSGMSNVTGYILPIKEIVRLAKEKGALTVVDAAQLVVHKKINVKDLDVDFLGFSGHKIYGPTGIGVLFGKKELIEKSEPFRVGGGMITRVERSNAEWKQGPERFEAGTPNIAGAIGLAAAIDYLKSVGIEVIENHEKDLTEYAKEKLAGLEFVETYIPADLENFSSVISFNVKGVHAHDTADILGQNNVAVRAGHHCAQLLLREVLKVDSTARMSLALYNSKEDIDKLINALQRVKGTFK